MRQSLERLECEQCACAHGAHVRVQTWEKEHHWKWHERNDMFLCAHNAGD